MPFTINHQPSAASIARVGYQAGAGQFAQQQREMALRERMQMRSINARQQMAMFDSQQRNQRMVFDAANRQRLQHQRNKAIQAAEQAKIANDRDMAMLQQRLAEDAAARQFEREEESDLRQLYTARTDDMWDRVQDARMAGFEYGPEDQRRHDEIMAKMRELRKKKSTITPRQYAEAEWHLANQLPIPSEPVKTPRDIFEENTVTTSGGQTYYIPPDGDKPFRVDEMSSSEIEARQQRRIEEMTPVERIFADPDTASENLIKITDSLTEEISTDMPGEGSRTETRIPDKERIKKYLMDFFDAVEEVKEMQREKQIGEEKVKPRSGSRAVYVPGRGVVSQ